MTSPTTVRLAVFVHTVVREISRIIGWERGYTHAAAGSGVTLWRPFIRRVDLLAIAEYLLPLLQMGVYSKDQTVAM